MCAYRRFCGPSSIEWALPLKYIKNLTKPHLKMLKPDWDVVILENIYTSMYVHGGDPHGRRCRGRPGSPSRLPKRSLQAEWVSDSLIEIFISDRHKPQTRANDDPISLLHIWRRKKHDIRLWLVIWAPLLASDWPRYHQDQLGSASPNTRSESAFIMAVTPNQAPWDMRCRAGAMTQHQSTEVRQLLGEWW